MITRHTYLDVIIPLINKDIIKVITGVRRAGKTVILQQIQTHLRENGITPERIVYINFESKKYENFVNTDALYEFLIASCQRSPAKTYIFLDEIQTVIGWEKVIASIKIDVDCDIYITGSNSQLLSGELATYIAGRYIQIQVFPFTLSEAKEITIQNGTFTSNEDLFEDYLKYGGLPMRFSLEKISLEPYLSDTYDAIVIKDILLRNKIKDQNLLQTVLAFLMDNIANPFSARAIVSTLSTAKVKTSVETIISYTSYIINAMIMSEAGCYDIKGKKLLTTGSKYFAMDVGLRNVVKSDEHTDYNKLFENIVYLELLSRGYTVKVGKTGDNEVDFIAYKGFSEPSKIYIQVCYLLATEETIKREFGSLERIDDNFPKYVISADRHNFSRGGIEHINIIDFLLNK